MKTSVTLQEPFSYAVLPIFLIGTLIICYGIYLLVSFLKKKQPKQKPVRETVHKPDLATDIQKTKQKYLTELEHINRELCNGHIATREAYQNMSLCIRHFVYEVTGIQVQNYTLQDIKNLNMPNLEALITEYYASEFAPDSFGDTTASLEKTKRAIELWK